MKSGKTALKGKICPGGADKFFFWRPIGRDLAESQGCSREDTLVGGETTGLARSRHKTWSIECNGVLDKIKNSVETLVVNVVCGVGYE